jgi:hypothetical protein
MGKNEVNAGAGVKSSAYKAGEFVTCTAVAIVGTSVAFVAGVAITGYETVRDFAQGLMHFPNA